jgi:hypothetical protein
LELLEEQQGICMEPVTREEMKIELSEGDLGSSCASAKTLPMPPSMTAATIPCRLG